MLLRDGDLAKAVAGGWLGVDPWDPELLQPSSIDVRLDRHFQVFAAGQRIDPSKDGPEMVSVEVEDGKAILLEPGQMVLGSTLERITVGPDLAARVEGKSGVGRLGVAIHVTAGFIDPGFDGHVTLELVNMHRNNEVLLWPGMRIGQLCVLPMSGKADRPYGADGLGSHYQGQRGPTPSRMHVGWKTWRTTSPS